MSLSSLSSVNWKFLRIAYRCRHHRLDYYLPKTSIRVLNWNAHENKKKTSQRNKVLKSRISFVGFDRARLHCHLADGFFLSFFVVHVCCFSLSSKCNTKRQSHVNSIEQRQNRMPKSERKTTSGNGAQGKKKKYHSIKFYVNKIQLTAFLFCCISASSSSLIFISFIYSRCSFFLR